MRVRKLTSRQLQALGACLPERKAFNLLFPDGVRLDVPVTDDIDTLKEVSYYLEHNNRWLACVWRDNGLWRDNAPETLRSTAATIVRQCPNATVPDDYIAGGWRAYYLPKVISRIRNYSRAWYVPYMDSDDGMRSLETFSIPATLALYFPEHLHTFIQAIIDATDIVKLCRAQAMWDPEAVFTWRGTEGRAATP